MRLEEFKDPVDCDHQAGDAFGAMDPENGGRSQRMPPDDVPEVTWSTCFDCDAFDPLSIQAYRELGGVESFPEGDEP